MDDTEHPDTSHSVLVLGASGYVGGRLVPELLRAGHRVRCMTRSPETLTAAVPWADQVEIVAGDLLEPASLCAAFDGVHTVVYLVHSLDEDGDFETTERRAAEAACVAADDAGVAHVVYLSGLGAGSLDDLSPHLASRHAVGEELARGEASVTELRAAVVLGAGSASFEMLRHLADVLPVMLAPRWVTSTLVQPIAIADVLTYLRTAVDSGPTASHRIVEIGGADTLTYRQLIDRYTDAAGLPRRRILPVPVIPPRLSAHWVDLVTPLPRRLSARLIDSLRHDVVVTDDSAAVLSDHRTFGVTAAIEMALAAIEDLEVPTRWSGVSSRVDAARPRPWDPDWAGGTLYEDRRSVTTTASANAVMATIRGIGGERGWFGFGPLWRLRGVADQLVGGVGLRRGRRHPDDITPGEALDFWRVDAVETDLFRLRAEMRLPGEAWLEWTVSEAEGSTEVVQRARYAPAGLLGRLYWWVLVPFHAAIFPIMLRRIVSAAERRPMSPVESDSTAA